MYAYEGAFSDEETLYMETYRVLFLRGQIKKTKRERMQLKHQYKNFLDI